MSHSKAARPDLQSSQVSAYDVICKKIDMRDICVHNYGTNGGKENEILKRT